MKIKYLILLGLISLPACSVFMAADKKGVDFDTFAQCKTRECIIANGAVSISKVTKGGSLVSEVFKAQKPTGSAARATMHGVLDVATIGLWEVAGTPIEGSMDKKNEYAFKVIYEQNADSNDIKAIQIAR